MGAEFVVRLKGRELQRVAVEKMHVFVGRDAMNDIIIDNPSVSRRHGVMEFRGDGFYVRDLGSANGIFVDGQAVKDGTVAPGQVVQLGKFELVVVWDGKPLALFDNQGEPLRLDENESTTLLTVEERERMAKDRRTLVEVNVRQATLPPARSTLPIVLGIVAILVVTGLAMLFLR